MQSKQRYAPAAGRNAQPIINVLKNLLPASGSVLEAASGTGQHAALFAQCFPSIEWQPSDPDEASLESIGAYVDDYDGDNLLPPIMLDVEKEDWQCAPYDVVLAINLIHIAPWSVSQGLFRGASTHLKPGGQLILYGPYRFFGHFGAASNESFDAMLRGRNAQWGVRDLADVCALAAAHDLCLHAVTSMPANNHMLVFRTLTRP